jgi:hypothetical protein
MVGDQLRFVALDAPADFVYARSQMALSLGWHIIVACFGVAFPAMVLFAEWRGHAGDRDMAPPGAHLGARDRRAVRRRARSRAPSCRSRWACCGRA